MKQKKQKFNATNSALYFFFMSAGALLGVMKYALFAKLLDPSAFGIYSLVLTTYVYILYAGGLGLNEGLIKLGAGAYGSGDAESISRLRDISLVYGGGATLFCGALYVAGVAFFVKDASTAASLSLAAVLAVAVLAFNLVDASLRSSQRFLLFSAMLFLKALLVVLTGLYLAPRYGANGAVLGEIAGTFILFLAFIGAESKGFRLKSMTGSGPLLKKAVANGFPLVISMFLRNISMSADRWVMAASIGLVAVAKYSFAMVIYLVALTGMGFLTNILGPRWLADHSMSRDVPRLFGRIRRTASWIVAAAIAGMIPAIWLLNLVTEKYYPGYAGTDLFWTMVLIYAAATVLVCTQLFDWLFVATSNEAALLKISVAALLMTAILVFAAYYLKAGIVFYAGAFLFCRVFIAVLYLWPISSLLKSESRRVAVE